MKFKYKTKPWKHQEKALEYLYERDCAALYTDMGTGKTKVMIDLIQNRNFKRVLVVAPNNACEVWESEIETHGFESQFSVFRLNSMSVNKVVDTLLKIPKKTTSAIDSVTYVFIINYEKVWREKIAKIFLRKTFGIDCVICDESHRIKSPRSNCSRYLAKLGKRVSHRYLVTGTPLAENPIDVYAQYRFLDPTIFGTNFTDFRDEYEVLDPVLTAKIGHRIRDKEHPFKNLKRLRKKMFSCAFYIHSSVELPEQTDIEYKVMMPKATEEMYHKMLKERVLEIDGNWLESDNVLTTILRLQQITSGYASVENIETKEKQIVSIDNAKIEALQTLLEDLPVNEPVVVFCQYKKDLKDIHKLCKNMGIKSSELSGRENTLKDWKEGRSQVIAIQYSSGSESISLVRARYCIYYSLSNRLALYEQSRKRIHRPGQDKPVVYYHLIEHMSKGLTIDEKMYKALKSKKDIVNYVIEKGWK